MIEGAPGAHSQNKIRNGRIFKYVYVKLGWKQGYIAAATSRIYAVVGLRKYQKLQHNLVNRALLVSVKTWKGLK